LSDNPKLVAEMGINSRKLAEEKFNRTYLADQLRIALENTLKEYK
jgi:hypothetical protein